MVSARCEALAYCQSDGRKREGSHRVVKACSLETPGPVPHSFRVATGTDLLEQNVPLGDMLDLISHADPRTTRIYGQRRRKVMRNIVARISI
jgi:hypothetical protein